MNNKKIKFIATTKEWHYKVNGNTYFSTRIEDIENDEMYILPFQYGYGSQSEYEVKKVLDACHKCWYAKSEVAFENIRFIKIDRCLKKEVKEHGKGNNFGLFSLNGTRFYYQD